MPKFEGGGFEQFVRVSWFGFVARKVRDRTASQISFRARFGARGSRFGASGSEGVFQDQIHAETMIREFRANCSSHPSRYETNLIHRIGTWLK